MKKILYLLMLTLSIKGQACAQESGAKTNSDKVFDQPANASRRFWIDLDKGNKVQIELADINDLERLSNMDSVLSILIQDLEPFKDSLSDELSAKRIDYITDSAGMKKIRIRQYHPAGSSYLVKNGEVAALKLEQDTINYIGMVRYKAKENHREFAAVRYYRLSFYLNNFNQLPAYLNGSLQEKIGNLSHEITGGWAWKSDGHVHLIKDNLISARSAKGYVTGGDFIGSRLAVDVQNYKHYFVPSFSLGAALTLTNSYFKKEIGLFWEPQFLFVRNSQGDLQTFRNDFLTLTLGQGFVKGNDPKKEAPFLTIFSIGYLIKRSGDYFDNHTFRAGAGRLSLFDGKIKIEPAFYFNNFFKGVTPSVRLTVSF